MKILMPLPDRDFDTTETAVPWKLLTRAGHEVVFATEEGQAAACDPLLLSGVLFGALGAEPEPKTFYAEMIAAPEFGKPLRWRELDMRQFDALFLAGGHAPGMKQYLGSEVLQKKVQEFWSLGRPVASICHGPVVLARAGVLGGYRTTCLPKYMERTAYFITAWRRGRYYRTYDAYVEDEVRAAGALFERGPRVLMARGTEDNDKPTFTVRDRHYVSARWPGDSYRIARELIQMLADKAKEAA